MTSLLKQLLQRYGLLFVTVTQLERERPGTEHATLKEFYKSLGPADPGEPILAVRVSKDGDTRFLRDVDPTSIPLGDDYKLGNLTVLELPEDEFYFFQAFRPGLFDLERQLPQFFMQMALIYGYTLFETYIADLIRMRLSAHPQQLGRDKHVKLAEILDAESKDVLVSKLVDREMVRLMHQPIGAILDRLRGRLGFSDLTRKYDKEIMILSLMRNCLIHNGGKADSKLVDVDPSLSFGQSIDVQSHDIFSAIDIFRKLAVSVDTVFEQLQNRETGSP
jgi:hypothetical protein